MSVQSVYYVNQVKVHILYILKIQKNEVISRGLGFVG